MSRLQSIPGLTYKAFIGAGGFADVYLYESTSPVRDVAVKILHDKILSDSLIHSFLEEANTMAALEHPYIVRVYSSGFTDTGQPYIEMAYYPNQTLAQAIAEGPLPLPEVLRFGVQLASAVETAHQVGLLHRDIKPANILIDRFGDPALTDFGVASHMHDVDSAEASLSVPWSPPEAMFATMSIDRTCDIYSLAATLYHLLVGHAPFEIPGGDNNLSTMMARVRDLPVPPIGRDEVPVSLERLLQQAMSKDQHLRPDSAAIFARALNAIEEELHLRPTPFKVAKSTRRSEAPVSGLAGDRTRVRGQAVAAHEPDKTRLRSNPVETESDDLSETKNSRRLLLIGVVIIGLIVIAVVVWIGFGPKPSPPVSTVPTTVSAPPDDGHFDSYPGVPVMTAEIVGDSVTFTWVYDRSSPSDFYIVDTDAGSIRLDDPIYTTKLTGETVCITVRVVRGTGVYAPVDGTKKCAP